MGGQMAKKREDADVEPGLTGAEFADAVARVSGCAKRKGPFEQTSLIHLKSVGNKLGLRACDLLQEASVSIPYAGFPLDISVNGELLSKLAPSFVGDELLSIETTTNHGEILLRGESSIIRIPATREVKPPEFPRAVPDYSLSISGARLAEAINGVIFALDSEENISHPAMNGLLLRSKGKVTITAASQKWMMERTVVEDNVQSFEAVIPAFAAAYMASNFKDSSPTFAFNRNQLIVKGERSEYRSVLLGEKFPDTSALFKRVADQTVEQVMVNREEIMHAIATLAPLYPRLQKVFNPMMRLEITSAHCRVSTNFGESSHVSIHGYREADQPVTLDISGTQMLETFKHLKCNMVVVRFCREPHVPIIVEPPEGEHDAGNVRALFASAKEKR